jgi:protein-S-isoprenylcysteine O-methyltransferase Ste14
MQQSSVDEASRSVRWFQRAWARCIQLVEIVAGMSGLFLNDFTPLRMLATGTIAVIWLGLTLSDFHPSVRLAYGSFAVLYLLRYAFLFLSFTRYGIAPKLRRYFGKEHGFSIYEAITALFFAARGLSFAWLLEVTKIHPSSATASVLIIAGGLCALVGTVVNIWAARVVGMGTYYYRDLFMGETSVDFKVEGPYRIWKNPMYGVGQLAGYGAALMALSPLGVLAGVLNQVTMYLFNGLIEQPHIRGALSR